MPRGSPQPLGVRSGGAGSATAPHLLGLRDSAGAPLTAATSSGETGDAAGFLVPRFFLNQQKKVEI